MNEKFRCVCPCLCMYEYEYEKSDVGENEIDESLHSLARPG